MKRVHYLCDCGHIKTHHDVDRCLGEKRDFDTGRIVPCRCTDFQARISTQR